MGYTRQRRTGAGRDSGRGSSSRGCYRNQFRGASRALDGTDGIFRRKSSHQERALAIGCHQYGGTVEALNVLSSVETAAVYFDQELLVSHVQLS